METLQRQARCAIFDHRGHGGSKEANRPNPTMETLASDLNEIIQGMSLSNVTLLGWSMGAGVVFNYVRLFGCGAVRQIILCDMTPKQLNDAEWKLGLVLAQRWQWLAYLAVRLGLAAALIAFLLLLPTYRHRMICKSKEESSLR